MSENDIAENQPGLDEQIFNAMQAYEILKQTGEKQSLFSKDAVNHMSRLLLNDIVHCIKFPGLATSSSTRALVNTQLNYRRLYRTALGYLSQYQSPEQIAASSDKQVLEREEEDFSIIVERTEGTDTDIEVKVSLRQVHEGQRGAGSLEDITLGYLHCESSQGFELIELKRSDPPKTEDMDLYSRTLLLSTSLNRTNRRAQALMDPNTHISFTY